VTPESVKADTDAYRQESNPISPFLEENCIEGDNLMIISADLWATYQQWSRNEGEKYPLSRNGFGRRMTGKGFTNPLVKIDGKPVRVWKGLTTINENEHVMIPD
jgi:phage/plasmid-associated DNA primase